METKRWASVIVFLAIAVLAGVIAALFVWAASPGFMDPIFV